MTWRIAILLTVAARGWACSCGGAWPSVKDMWQEAPYVFLGTVELADPDIPGDQATFQSQSVRIRIDEAFKGISPGQTIELHQGGNDCAAKFRTGQRFVFYLYRSPTAAWVVAPCSHALGDAKSGSDDLLFLRGLPKSAVGTRLSGTVTVFEQTGSHEYRSDPVPDVKVLVTGPRGFTRDTVTNAAGAYEVYGLPSGAYSVQIDFPRGMTAGSSAAGATSNVQLARNGSITAGFTLRPDTSLSARVLGADGFPSSDPLCFQLEPIQTPGETIGFECAIHDGGNFTFTEIPPGQYRLVTTDTVVTNSFGSKSTLYYPGVRDRAHAGVITIEGGKYVDGLEIRIPSNEARKRLGGKLLYADGAPASGSTVTFTSPELGYSESTSAGADGSFAFYVLAGMKGQLSAEMSIMQPLLGQCPQFVVQPRWRGMFRFMDSNVVTLSADSDQDNLKLEMPSASCQYWPPRPK